MKKYQRRRSVVFSLVGLAGTIVTAPIVIGQMQAPPARDPAKELALKIKAPFTLASAGDLLQFAPISHFTDPGFQNTIKIVRDADAAVANMEANIVDMIHFEGPLGNVTAPREVAADVKALGFDLVNRANNHTFDSGVEGMFATQNLLEEAGLVHAGTGKNLEAAREARYFQSSKGRVGVVGMYSTSGGNTRAASYRLGNTGGEAGLNPLRVSSSLTVTAEQMAALRQVRDAIYTQRSQVSFPVPQVSANEPKDRLQLFGTSYRVGPNPGTLTYTINQEDLRDILRSVRNGKFQSEFMIVTIHAHEAASAVEMGLFSDRPPDFLIELAHKAIDNGADAFVGHGPHVLRGVEIYKGKPIFYGQGEFVRQIHRGVANLNRYSAVNLDPYTTEKTAAELVFESRTNQPLMQPENFEGLLAESKYDGGRLVEVRLHPTLAGYGQTMSEMGVPRTPTADEARKLLEKLQTLSKPFGTTIAIEGNTGVIRVAATAGTAAQ